jgi:Leucine rich repeat variant
VADPPPEVLTAPRPRAMPARVHRQERAAWLQQCVGDEHAAAVRYFAGYPQAYIPARAVRSTTADIRCLLANPVTTFDDFVMLLAGGLSIRKGWRTCVPYDLDEDDLSGREHWWADLLASCFPDASASNEDQRRYTRMVAERLLQRGGALIDLAWPALAPRDWAPAYAATAACGRQRQVIARAAHAVRPGEIDTWGLRTRDLVDRRGVSRLLTREQAMEELRHQLAWSDEALQVTEELRSCVVADAIAGVSVLCALDLLPLPDRLHIAQAAAPEAEPDWFVLLLATTPLPAQEFDRRCSSHDLDRMCAVIANPFAPIELSLRAARAALQLASPAPKDDRWHRPATRLLRSVLTARGWLPADVVHEVVQGIAAQPGAPVEALALVMAQAPGMPLLEAGLRAGIVTRLEQQGWRLPADLVRAMPFDAQAACIRSHIHQRQDRYLGNPDFLDAILRMDDEVRVLAARHGGAATMPRLAQDPSERVRAHVARNSQAPREILVALAADPQEAVASQVARNAKVDAGLLALLAARDGRCRKAATRVTLRALG